MSSLSRIDLFFLLKELKQLEGAKVSKISQPSKREFFLEFHLKGEGKKLLRFGPDFVFISSQKTKSPINPFHFCSVLRLRLNNSILTKVSQPNMERVYEFVFSSKNGFFRLYVELFGKGNVVLTTEDGSIILALEAKSWSSREIKVNRVYSLPPKKVDLLSITSDEIYSLISSSTSQSLVQSIATQLGVGGVFAEEICHRLDLSKSSSVDIKKTTAASIKNCISSILKSKIRPFTTSNKPHPIRLKTKEVETPFNTFSEAIETVHSIKPVKENPQIVSLKKIIASQKEAIENLKTKMQDEAETGEKIYLNYDKINAIFLDFKEERDRKKLMKKHKMITEWNDKGNPILEL